MNAHLTASLLILALSPAAIAELPEVEAVFSPAPGIGPQDGVMRRDPSDIINVGDHYHVWYSEDGMHFKPTHRISPTPSGAGAYRPDAFTGSNKGSPISWGTHILNRRDGLPALERFDLRWPSDSQTE